MIGLITSSCEKEIDLKIDENDKKIVIQGNISNDESAVVVLITKSGQFHQTSDFQTVNTAEVSVLVDGVSHQIPFVGGGYYKYDGILPEEGKVYALTVEVEGDTYTAKTIYPKGVDASLVDLDFIPGDSYIKIKNAIDFNKGKTYLKTKWAVNGVFPSYSFYNLGRHVNENDGDTLHIEEYFYKEGTGGFGSSFIPGDVLETFYYSLDATTYNYFEDLAFAGYQELGSLNPYNPKNNFDQLNVLGYFGAYQLTKLKITLP